MKYNTTRRNKIVRSENNTRRMNADITGGAFRDGLKIAATHAKDSINSVIEPAGKFYNKSINEPMKEGIEEFGKKTQNFAENVNNSFTSASEYATQSFNSISNIKDLGILTSFFKMFLQIVPDNVWKLTAESTLNKICETVRDADTAVPGDPKSTGCTIKIDIIKQANELIAELIKGINPQKMQQRIMEKLMEKMKDPLDEIMNQECIALKILVSLLSKEDLKNFLFVYLTSDYVMESQGSQGNTLLDFIDNKHIDNYFTNLSQQKVTVINEQSQNEKGELGKDEKGELGKDEEVVSNINDLQVVNGGEDIVDNKVDPDISKYRKRLDALIQTGGGTLASLNADAQAIKDTAETVIKSFNSLMQTIITTIMAEADADAKSENENSDKKIFLKASDMANRIINAASFHLEKPEGRQMYLRQFEKLISRSINDISRYDALMIPLFKQCLKNEGFIKLLDSYIRNDFMNPSTQDNILVTNDPFELTADITTKLTESITFFLDGFKEKVKTRLEEINPVETIYNDIEGSKCKTYGSIPEETINHKRKLDEERHEELDEERDEERDNNQSIDGKKEGTYVYDVPKNGGNIRTSRNKKYSPKKQKQTRRKR